MYLTLTEFKDRTTMLPEYVDAIEARSPGWVEGQLTQWSAWMDGRLRKRYAAPFSLPYPEIVQAWLARIVTVRCYLRRGVDATDEQFQEIREDAKEATEEIKEAADSNTGLYDLPLNAGTAASGIAFGSPLGYSEQSPYVGLDKQRKKGRSEDESGEGSE